MKKVYGICLNSAIDYLIHSIDILIGEVNKSQKVDKIPAGKLVNSLRTFEFLEAPITCHVYVGKNDFNLFDCFNNNIDLHLHSVNGANRSNFTIISEDKKVVTHITSPSIYELEQQETLEFLTTEIQKWERESIVILSGSLPNGLSISFYKLLIKELNKRNIKTILDTSSKAFQLALEAKPYSIKPNLKELNELNNTNLSNNDHEQIIDKIKSFWKNGIEIPVVTLGKNGAIYGFLKTKNIYHAYHSDSSDKQEGNSTGCGDSFVAALAYSLAYSLNEKELIEYTQSIAWENLKSPIPGEIINPIKELDFSKIKIAKLPLPNNVYKK